MRKLGIIISLSLLGVIVFSPSVAQAGVVRGQNPSEGRALQNCIRVGGGGPWGALWFSSADKHGDSVFSGINEVTVENDATSVVMNVRGSALNCGGDTAGPVYATNIRQGKGEAGKRLISLESYGNRGRGRRVYRGHLAGFGSYNNKIWTDELSTKVNFLPVTIDIKDVVRTEAGGVANVELSMFRCQAYEPKNQSSTHYDNGGLWDNGKDDLFSSWCYSEPYTITVTRKPAPKYQTDARSFVKLSNQSDWGEAGRTINVEPGETIHFQHTIESVNNSENSGKRIRNLVVRAHGDYPSAQGITFNDLQSQHFKGSPHSETEDNSYSRKNISSVVKQGPGIFFRASPTNPTGGGTSMYQSYTVKPSDIGKTFCQGLEFNSYTQGREYYQTPYQRLENNISVTKLACVYVAYDYTIPLPGIVGGSGNACGGNCGEVEAGTPQVPLRANMLKPDKTAKTKPIEWKLTHFVVKPNQAIPGVGISPKDENGNPLSGGFVSEYGVDPCATSIYNTAAVYNTVDTSKRIQRCQTIANGTIANLDSTKTIDIPSLGMGDPLNKFSVPESAEVGTKYCFALSISPYMMSKDWDKARQDSFKKWYHGKPGCIIVVKKPKTQFLGGGIYAGSGVVASQSTRVTAYSRRTGPQSTSTSNVERKFGSWVEYELVVNKGTNNGLATNGIFGPTMVGIADPNQAVTGIAGRTTKDVKFQNRLTLANNASTYGNFGGSINYAQSFFTRLKNYYQSRSSGMVQYTTRLRVVAGSEYKSNIDVNLSAISNTGGKTTVIYAPNNTVTISGNIQNTNVNVRSVGQTIIIAKNININPDVTRVDAWLLASDSIDTCKITGSLSSTVCNKHLLVNGPVVVASNKADGLKLNRTAGSEGAGDGIGNPGETFLLGYDAYQWIVNQANVGGVRITTSYTKELPVRY